MITIVAVLSAAVGLSACSPPPAPVSSGVGRSPELPAPTNRLLPTVNIADAEGWRDGEMPAPAPGLVVTEFASGLDHPRWVYELPNGDVLVAESNAPPRPEDGTGLRGFFMRRILARAGAGGSSADRITLLRDGDGNGVAEMRSTFLENLDSPFGMTLVGDTLFIANTDGIVRVPYRRGMIRAAAVPDDFISLPAGPINRHWTKNIVAGPDGRMLYAAVGSNSNVAENGIEAERARASIWQINIATGQSREFATGLRNPVGMDFDRATGMLYTVVNERDELGDNLVPDYLTSVTEGAFYGWPYSYFGQIVDGRVSPQRPDLVASAVVPDYALGAHTASLGLDIADRATDGIAERYGRGAFVGQHGSWNRKPRSGYKVIFVPFVNGRPEGQPQTILAGFLDGDIARGRPVGVILDRRGGLLVADDVGNRIWRVSVGPPT